MNDKINAFVAREQKRIQRAAHEALKLFAEITIVTGGTCDDYMNKITMLAGSAWDAAQERHLDRSTRFRAWLSKMGFGTDQDQEGS